MDWTYAPRTIRRTAQSTTPLNIDCMHTLPAPVTIHGENEDWQGLESHGGYFDESVCYGKKMQRKFP
ncbi:MAG: hypothetical protein PHY16_14100 [Methylobacter sp.]|nr:hypothetical protein [Methylobacter sp.]